MFSWRIAAFFILLLFGILVAVLVQPRMPLVVHGVVQNEDGPVAGAVVRVRSSAQFVMTREDGTFTLPVDSSDAHELTAWAPGHFIGSSEAARLSPVTIDLHAHPKDDNAGYRFISPILDMDDPFACSHCHRSNAPDEDRMFPVYEWLQDAHSGAAVNPRFLSLYNGTSVEGMFGSPTRFEFDPVAGVSVPQTPSLGMGDVGPGFRLDFPDQVGTCATCHVPVAALEAPYHADPNLADGVASEGVTCDFCHKIQDVRLPQDGLPDPGMPGVLSYEFLRPHEGEQAFLGPFDDVPGEDIYSALQNRSEFCAPCHAGQFWDVPIYNSFGEWLDSPYSDPENGQTCQDCHMPHVGAVAFARLSSGSETLPPRDPNTIFSHKMPGAANQQLLEAAATLEVVATRQDESLRVVVRVTNSGAGHHIPTDNPLRNMILVVQATDGEGLPLALLEGPLIPVWGGAGDPADGYYAGLPGVLYAKVLADFFTGEMPSYAYWRQTRLVADNRIPALATDETVYDFALPEASAETTVTVKLLLRRAFIDLMDVKGWETPDMLMASETISVP